ncbi:hypothetical protein ACKWTF_015699 [Chironomus riparius]
MGKPDEPLTGFSWRSGTKRDTTGIVMWSDVFLHTFDKTAEKIAIFVMDTQGLFDSESTSDNNTKISALGILLPSIEIVNISKRLQENHLEHIQFATSYAKQYGLDDKNISDKPFQNLMFLIRDWVNEDEFKFGFEGGEFYLNENILKIKESQNVNLKSVRESIKKYYENVRCCLLPHPEKKVVKSSYDGRLSCMDDELRQELKNVIENLLLPENMILKKINSKELTVNEMKTFIQKYFEIFQSNKIPETKTLYELTVENFMNNLVKNVLMNIN